MRRLGSPTRKAIYGLAQTLCYLELVSVRDLAKLERNLTMISVREALKSLAGQPEESVTVEAMDEALEGKR